MFHKLKILLRQVMHDGDDSGHTSTQDLNLAMAALLCEVAKADADVEASEHQAKVELLQKLLELPKSDVLALIEQAKAKVEHAISLYDFTSQLRSLEQETRYELIKAMWSVAYADGVIDPLEDAVIRKVSELLYVDHKDFIRAKLAVQN
ncbi:MAG: TerB family tellurite resistance protein [Aliivibrio sp.]|uniref:tellurite resistance TerB family protein n=1 Tax=Aliivibrio sp. TaxID=1872443 RepID=UPI001A4A1102|nr:TerB family tellurite resistance protein [Aliivibrio sp.]